MLMGISVTSTNSYHNRTENPDLNTIPLAAKHRVPTDLGHMKDLEGLFEGSTYFLTSKTALPPRWADLASQDKVFALAKALWIVKFSSRKNKISL
jgi:hypothetical protein